MQWNNIKKCILDTMSNLVGKIERKARKLWITQEIVSTMDEYQWQLMEGRTTEDWGTKEQIEKSHRQGQLGMSWEHMCKRTGRFDVMNMKMKDVGWKKNHGIQNIVIDDSKGNVIVDQRQVLKIWDNYFAELHN